MLIYVLSKNGKPLMPCSIQRADNFLKKGKAIVVSKCPFTIKMLKETKEYQQEVKAVIVPSSSKIGSAASTDNRCVFSAETELRTDIAKKMKGRSSFRRNRRNRKTRYRACRFNNRKSDRKLNPTMRSKLESHEREIKRISKILPVTTWTVVRNSVKPEYKGFKKLEWLNLQRQVFERDSFKCRHCKGKSKSHELHAHHIIHRADGGKDLLENLVTLCKECHVKYHEGKLKLKIGKPISKGKRDTELAIIRKYLKLPKNTKSLKTYGFKVKARRIKLQLEPTALNNACAVLRVMPNNSYYILNKNQGDYQRRKGSRSELEIPKGKIMGFHKFDKVKLEGKTYFIKGRMSSGYFIGMDILGNTFKGKTLKAKDLKLVSRRASCLITEMVEGNTCYNIENQG